MTSDGDGVTARIDPWFVLEITPRCNSGCVYCYNVWHGGPMPAESGTDRLVDLFRKLGSETRIAGVTLAGGEPLLSPSTAPLARHLASMDIPVGIVTNGILLDGSTARELSGSGVRYFEISMPAASADTGITLTGSDIGARARSAVISARPYASRLTVSTVLTELSADETVDVAGIAWSLSADAFYLNRFVPGGRGAASRSRLEPSRSTLVRVLDGLDRFSGETGFPVFTGIPVEPCAMPRDRWPNIGFGPCVCGTVKWVIDPRGRLRTCEQSPVVLGDLFTEAFPDLAGSDAVLEFRSSGLRGDQCRSCPDLPVCGGGCRFLID